MKPSISAVKNNGQMDWIVLCRRPAACYLGLSAFISGPVIVFFWSPQLRQGAAV
jgi:Na+/pantothenate symporter